MPSALAALVVAAALVTGPLVLVDLLPPRTVRGFYTVDVAAPHLSDRDWMSLTSALAGPLLSRLRDQQHHQYTERLESLQTLLGTGWWEMLGDEVLLAPSLLDVLPADSARISLQDWLALIHPADREELRAGSGRRHR